MKARTRCTGLTASASGAYRQFLRSGDPRDSRAAREPTDEQPRTEGLRARSVDRLSYTLTMRPIIPAREALASTATHDRAHDAWPLAATMARERSRAFRSPQRRPGGDGVHDRLPHPQRERCVRAQGGGGNRASGLGTVGGRGAQQRRIRWLRGPAGSLVRGTLHPLRGDWLATRARELGQRFRHRSGARVPAIRVRDSGTARGGLLHRARKRALASGDGAARDGAGRRWRLRSPAYARRAPLTSPCAVPAAVRGLARRCAEAGTGAEAWPGAEAEPRVERSPGDTAPFGSPSRKRSSATLPSTAGRLA